MASGNKANKVSTMRQQISSEPNIQPVVKVKVENLYLEQGSTSISKRTLGNAWIVGSSTNGIVGPNTNTQNGSQQVVGGAGRLDILQFVLNPDDKYIERFQNTLFFDSASSTGSWSSGSASLTTGQTIRSKIIAKSSKTIFRATLNTNNSSSDLTYYMKVEGRVPNSGWEEVTPGVEHTFGIPGTELFWRVDSTGTQSINLVQIKY